MTLELEASLPDQVTLFYSAEGGRFRDTNIDRAIFGGPNSDHKVSLWFPSHANITHLRLLFGRNKNQKTIKLDAITFRHRSNEIGLSGEQIRDYFETNGYLQYVDSKDWYKLRGAENASFNPLMDSQDLASMLSELYVPNPRKAWNIVMSVFVGILTFASFYFSGHAKNRSMAKRNIRYAYMLLACILLIHQSLEILPKAKENAGSRRVIAGDSSHYFQIARDFASGDFKMAYVSDGRAHRQPLYPLVLSISMSSESVPLAQLYVNLVVLLILSAVTYLLIWSILGSSLAALMGMLVITSNEFLIRNASEALLTEPLYILMVLAVLVAAIAYAKSPDRKVILLFSGFCALAYLSRPNGLFLFLSVLFGLVVTILIMRNQTVTSLTKYIVIAITAFIIISVPSWLPRLIYHSNPMYHEYLPNYLWADTYAEAHVPGPPRYSLQDYAAGHDLRDVWERVVHGSREVFIRVPSENLPNSILAVMGLALTFWFRVKPLWILPIVFFVSLLPIVWTFMSNPTDRIALASQIPFLVLWQAFFWYAFGEILLGRRPQPPLELQSFRAKRHSKPL